MIAALSRRQGKERQGIVRVSQMERVEHVAVLQESVPLMNRHDACRFPHDCTMTLRMCRPDVTACCLLISNLPKRDSNFMRAMDTVQRVEEQLWPG